MNSNLLVIFCIQSEDEICRMFLPYWQRSGCDLLFSSPLDAPSKLEGVQHVRFGRKLTDKASDYWFFQSRWLDTMKYCLTLPFEGFVFTCYDSICLGALPLVGRKDSIHTFACGPTPQFESTWGLHPPWCFGVDVLKEFVEAAGREPITLEGGVADRWLPCVMQRNDIAFEPCNWSWSRNGIDTFEYAESARQAIASGVLFVHGVKNKAQLDLILS